PKPDAIFGNTGAARDAAPDPGAAHRRGAEKPAEEKFLGDRAAALRGNRLAQLSIFAPASLTTLAHFAISLWISFSNSAGDSPPAGAPCASHTPFSSGERIAFTVS